MAVERYGTTQLTEVLDRLFDGGVVVVIASDAENEKLGASSLYNAGAKDPPRHPPPGSVDGPPGDGPLKKR
jgi:hypothetical protein